MTFCYPSFALNCLLHFGSTKVESVESWFPYRVFLMCCRFWRWFDHGKHPDLGGKFLAQRAVNDFQPLRHLAIRTDQGRARRFLLCLVLRPKCGYETGRSCLESFSKWLDFKSFWSNSYICCILLHNNYILDNIYLFLVSSCFFWSWNANVDSKGPRKSSAISIISSHSICSIGSVGYNGAPATGDVKSHSKHWRNWHQTVIRIKHGWTLKCWWFLSAIGYNLVTNPNGIWRLTDRPS